ncbi:unnamed protein product, partial [Dovyalis caffra]
YDRTFNYLLALELEGGCPLSYICGYVGRLHRDGPFPHGKESKAVPALRNFPI